MTAVQFESDFRQLELYGEDSEAWKVDYEAAERCFKIEKKLSFGVHLFRHLCWLDAAWLQRLKEKKVKYNPEVSEAITKLFQLWQKPCEKVLEAIASLEGEGFDVVGANEFRECCLEVEDLLEQRSWADRASLSRKRLAQDD